MNDSELTDKEQLQLVMAFGIALLVDYFINRFSRGSKPVTPGLFPFASALRRPIRSERELLEHDLFVAVQQERYEDAAGLRDRLKGLNQQKPTI